MLNVVLLDWDGPLHNFRSQRMDHGVDPVAAKVVSDLTEAGWLTVLTSTIRKHFLNDVEASVFLKVRGVHVKWLLDAEHTESWRTSPSYTAFRHLEFMHWQDKNKIHERYGSDVRFLAIDNERYPKDICTKFNIVQQPGEISPYNGLSFEAIKTIYKLIQNK